MKKIIDSWFNENYDKLINISKKKISYFGRNIDPHTVVSNAYLYIIDHKDLKTEDEIPCWVVNYINTELAFYNSKTIRSESVTVSDEKAPDVPSTEDITGKIDYDDFINEFVNTLDRYEQIVWGVYHNKGIDTSGKLAEHFNMDRTSAWMLKKNIETKFKEYVDTKKGL